MGGEAALKAAPCRPSENQDIFKRNPFRTQRTKEKKKSQNSSRSKCRIHTRASRSQTPIKKMFIGQSSNIKILEK